MKNTNLSRNLSLDIARIIAVFAVIMIHCSCNFVSNFAEGTTEFFWGNIFDSISRLGVPLFLMISGALMLDENKKITCKTLYSKNIKTIVLLTIAWSVIYSLFSQVFIPVLTGRTVSISDLIKAIINGHMHMWYLYLIVGLYIITPFLRAFVYKSNKNLVLLFIVIALSTQFLIPVINMLSMSFDGFEFINTFINKFHLNFFGAYTVYYLMGWYVVHIGFSKRCTYAITASGIIALAVILTYVATTKDYTNAYDNLGILVFLYSSAAFILINKIKTKTNSYVSRVVVSLSKMTFGVYIIHEMIRVVFIKFAPYNSFPLLYILFCFIFVAAISFITCAICSKIPLIKKLFKM